MVTNKYQTKLAYAEAQSIYVTASTEVIKYEHCKYRLGQAIWNLLPVSVAEQHRYGLTDFFCWVDEQKVLDCFFSEHYIDYSL